MQKLYSGSLPLPTPLKLYDSSIIPKELVTGSIEIDNIYFSGIQNIDPVYITIKLQNNISDIPQYILKNAVELQRTPSSLIIQHYLGGGGGGGDGFLQRIPASTIRQIPPFSPLLSLQRFSMDGKKGATLVWLMRARNTANTKYIYWRSPSTPGYSGISDIRTDTVETVGSVYEEL